MDDRRFDALTRALGGAASRRSALGALLGLGLAGTAEAGRKHRKKRCNPECPAGQTCRQGTCSCDDGGTVCGAHCCALGQRCESGSCVTPPAQCIPAGEACKGTGRSCCDGRTCASGQGGKGDIACYAPAGGPCETTAECVYDSTCQDGVCVANPQPVACIPVGESGCTETVPCCPGATCLTLIGASSGACSAPVVCDVCPSGCTYATIEAAIAGAASGATILVAPGTYTPAITSGYYNSVYLTVDGKALTLKSCDPQRTVTVACPAGTGGPYTDCIVATNGATLSLEGFAFEGSTTTLPVVGLKALVGSQVGVADVSFTQFQLGVLSANGGSVAVGAGVSVVNVLVGLMNNSSSLSCSATPTYTTTAVRCSGVSDPTCGC